MLLDCVFHRVEMRSTAEPIDGVWPCLVYLVPIVKENRKRFNKPCQQNKLKRLSRRRVELVSMPRPCPAFFFSTIRFVDALTAGVVYTERENDSHIPIRLARLTIYVAIIYHDNAGNDDDEPVAIASGFYLAASKKRKKNGRRRRTVDVNSPLCAT